MLTHSLGLPGVLETLADNLRDVLGERRIELDNSEVGNDTVGSQVVKGVIDHLRAGLAMISFYQRARIEEVHHSPTLLPKDPYSVRHRAFYG